MSELYGGKGPWFGNGTFTYINGIIHFVDSEASANDDDDHRDSADGD